MRAILQGVDDDGLEHVSTVGRGRRRLPRCRSDRVQDDAETRKTEGLYVSVLDPHYV